MAGDETLYGPVDCANPISANIAIPSASIELNCRILEFFRTDYSLGIHDSTITSAHVDVRTK